MRMAWLVLFAVLTGCGAHTNVRVGSGAAGAPPGTSVVRSSVGVHIEAGSAAAALIAAGILAAAWHAEERERGGYRAGSFSGAGAAPPLAEWRRVNAQDCTHPIGDASANLRCE